MGYLHLRLGMPVGFQEADRQFPTPMIHPAEGRWKADEWLPDFFVQPVTYRFVRVEPTRTIDADPAESLLQFATGDGYPVFLAHDPWRMALADECLIRMPDRAARVLTFTIDRPGFSTRWGVAAVWTGRSARQRITLLGLGPSQAFQAEVLAMLRDHRS
ncbi:MAG: hypothetical protein R2909_00195 [Gemmatimonadales bacterium]